MENIMKYIKAVTRTVTALAGRGCSCKFTLEDKHGKYQGYKPHDNWELWYQDHSDSDFEYFLKCIGCGYELAKKYWKDSDGTFVDYTDGIADSFWKCPTVDSRKFPSKESATEWTRPITIEDQSNSDRFDLADEYDDEIQRAEIRAGA
jgi:hypothetical protein|tara:strand:- start:1039 stop:1482 length:444 start_codon:yes stop_codon:yes gene_type:complete